MEGPSPQSRLRALDEISKPVLVALLRAREGWHGNDHRWFPRGQLLKDDGEPALA